MPLSLVREPIFLVGLVVRVALILFATPLVVDAWFLPFVEGAFSNPSVDPWTAHLSTGGASDAFPYGPVMYLPYFVGTSVGALVDLIFSADYFARVGFSAVTLAVDVTLLILLRRIFPEGGRKVLFLYWLSPIVLYVCYWHGQLDVVPVALVMASIFFLTSHAARRCGIFLALAVSSKLSMLLPLPFILIYFWRNKRLRRSFPQFVIPFALTGAVLQGGFIFSPGFREMVLGTPEIERIYQVSIPFGEDLVLFIVPIAFLLLIYAAWRLRRMGSDLLLSFLGIAFLLVVVATPAPTGWYLWVVPFLVAHAVRAGATSALLVTVFSLAFVILHLGFATGPTLAGADLTSPIFGFEDTAGRLHSLGLSGMAAIGLLLAVRFYIHEIRRNDEFRLGRKPILIGIAGNSGSGKDWLVRSLSGLFGHDSVSSISGDDYHKWERAGPMWRAFTHLDPRANDLNRFGRDVLHLMDGKQIVCRRYDHTSGRFTTGVSIRENDVIIVAGLHALYDPLLRERMDLRVFLEPDEDFRRFLKIRRDVVERFHTREQVLASFDARREDASRYVSPQADEADIVFSLLPVRPSDLVELGDKKDIRLKLGVRLRHGIYYEDLVRMLIGVCGMQVDVDFGDQPGDVRLLVEGEVTRADIILAVHRIVPQMEQLLALEPAWEDGVSGVMQLVAITHLANALQRRL